MDTKKPSSGAQKSIGDVAAKLAQLTDDVLFGEVWERPQLMITHLAFYVGWPNAFSAVARAKEVLGTKPERR